MARDLSQDDLNELHYLIGRLIGLRTRTSQDIDMTIYYDQYRIRIDVVSDLEDLAKETTP